MSIRQEISYSITEQDAGQTVERLLRRRGVSRHFLVQLKRRKGGLLLDGAPVHTNVCPTAGQILTVSLRQESQTTLEPQDIPLDIVYEDGDILVLNKPAGMPVHPSQGHYTDTLANALAGYLQHRGESFTARAIGRLDRDTTGLVLFALHELSACILSEAMRERRIHREYRSVCTGLLPERGVIDAPIARAPGSTIQRLVDEQNGERAVTHFQRLAYQNGYSLAAVRLETGRTHQIRVHMAHIGHPLPGDFLYNPVYDVIDRQALHSWRLSFAQPITGEELTLTAELPEDMKRILDMK